MSQGGTHIVEGDLAAIRDRLRLVLAAAGCDQQWPTPDSVTFRHGTMLTYTVSMMPKRGRMHLAEDGGRVRVDWTVESYGFARWWLTVWGVLFCWLVFPAILAHRAVAVEPRRFVERLLAAL